MGGPAGDDGATAAGEVGQPAPESDPLWQAGGEDGAKDMKNNMLDIFKNIGSIIPGNK
jgi:hypothetical protein